jgi:hypothetical protein
VSTTRLSLDRKDTETCNNFGGVSFYSFKTKNTRRHILSVSIISGVFFSRDSYSLKYNHMLQLNYCLGIDKVHIMSSY